MYVCMYVDEKKQIGDFGASFGDPSHGGLGTRDADMYIIIWYYIHCILIRYVYFLVVSTAEMCEYIPEKHLNRQFWYVLIISCNLICFLPRWIWWSQPVRPSQWDKDSNTAKIDGTLRGPQTWLAGKSTIEFDDFPTYKPSFSLGISQLAMFDNRRGT